MSKLFHKKCRHKHFCGVATIFLRVNFLEIFLLVCFKRLNQVHSVCLLLLFVVVVVVVDDGEDLPPTWDQCPYESMVLSLCH